MDTPIPPVEEPSVTVSEVSVPVVGPENADPQYSICDGSLVEGREVSEDVPLPVTPAAWSEREEMRIIEE